MSSTTKASLVEELERQYNDYRDRFEEWQEMNRTNASDTYGRRVRRFQNWEREVIKTLNTLNSSDAANLNTEMAEMAARERVRQQLNAWGNVEQRILKDLSGSSHKALPPKTEGNNGGEEADDKKPSFGVQKAMEVLAAIKRLESCGMLTSSRSNDSGEVNEEIESKDDDNGNGSNRSGAMLGQVEEGAPPDAKRSKTLYTDTEETRSPALSSLHSPVSPGLLNYSLTSPIYSPSSPRYSPTSPSPYKDDNKENAVQENAQVDIIVLPST